MSSLLTHVLLLTADKKLYHLQVSFDSGEFDDFYSPQLLRTDYIMDLATISPIEHIGDKFYFFSGNAFISYDADTNIHRQLFTLHSRVKSFYYEEDDSDGNHIFRVKLEDDSQIKVTYLSLIHI